MNIWFTSDTHFGHDAIRRHCNRPFLSADEMDHELVSRWNALVGPRDEVWHLGDFVFRSAAPVGDYLARLRGRKHLIWGNHDNASARSNAGWASSQAMAELKFGNHRIVLLHYAMRTWRGSHHGAFHLFGHSHGKMPGDRQSLDVGVDCWDFRPVSLDEILARMATQPERGGLPMEVDAA